MFLECIIFFYPILCQFGQMKINLAVKVLYCTFCDGWMQNERHLRPKILQCKLSVLCYCCHPHFRIFCKHIRMLHRQVTITFLLLTFIWPRLPQLRTLRVGTWVDGELLKDCSKRVRVHDCFWLGQGVGFRS